MRKLRREIPAQYIIDSRELLYIRAKIFGRSLYTPTWRKIFILTENQHMFCDYTAKTPIIEVSKGEQILVFIYFPFR